ncbi:MAG: hypothetical protein NT106_10520 [Candidatus Sumerlaeota bacterium]|nr:hypothetical protein [Candidatus Sumerlaeota bacterium]
MNWVSTGDKVVFDLLKKWVKKKKWATFSRILRLKYQEFIKIVGVFLCHKPHARRKTSVGHHYEREVHEKQLALPGTGRIAV